MSLSSEQLSLLAAARTATAAAAKTVPVPEPQWVAFTSRGVVLVTGNWARATSSLTSFRDLVRVVAFVPDAPADTVVPSNVRMIAAPILSLAGHLGRFSATSVPIKGEPVDAGRFSWNEDRHFDFVLDLNEVPLVSREIGPYGYFAPRTVDETAAAVAQIREHPSTRRKPRYFDYRATLCAHGAAGKVGCTRCLDACPAGAITSAGDKVAFDPFLCHGCGTCAAVCPEGAVRYAYPTADTTLDRLKVMLHAWMSTGASPPRLIIHVGSATNRALDYEIAGVPDGLPFSTPALAACGIEMWFAGLAWGASQIVLVPDATTARASIGALNEELGVAHAILNAIGEPAERIVFAEGTRRAPSAPSGSVGGIAGALSQESKRATLYAALDHLARAKTPSSQPVSLPRGASLGAVEVDQKRCTVCFACVNLCPTGALTSVDGPIPELRFTESSCVQCRLCEQGCPEQAISLLPSVNLNRSEREASRVLCTDGLFECVRCGSPFISKRLLARSMEMVKDHPLIEQEGVEILKLCMACRAGATMRGAAER